MYSSSLLCIKTSRRCKQITSQHMNGEVYSTHKSVYKWNYTSLVAARVTRLVRNINTSEDNTKHCRYITGSKTAAECNKLLTDKTSAMYQSTSLYRHTLIYYSVRCTVQSIQTNEKETGRNEDFTDITHTGYHNLTCHWLLMRQCWSISTTTLATIRTHAWTGRR
jgi:hypothetical protein